MLAWIRGSNVRALYRMRRSSQPMSVLALLLLPVLGVACGTESVRPEPGEDLAHLYWDLQLDYHAVALTTTAPYDTLTVVATPRNVLGDSLPGLPTPQYTSRDVRRVRITPDGQLKGVEQTTAHVWVIATLTAGNLKHTDSMQVQVVNTTTPPVLASLSIHPIPPDTAKAAIDCNLDEVPGGDALGLQQRCIGRSIPAARALDMSGAAITGLPIFYSSVDSSVIRVSPATGLLRGVRMGTTNLLATTTAFGVTKADTLPYRIGRPLYAFINVQAAPGFANVPVFIPSEISVAPGALLEFRTSFDTTMIDITFDNDDVANLLAVSPWSASFNDNLALRIQPVFQCVSVPFVNDGNIPDCTLSGNVAIARIPHVAPDFAHDKAFRVVSAPGVYDFRSTRYGIIGRITVIGDE